MSVPPSLKNPGIFQSHSLIYPGIFTGTSYLAFTSFLTHKPFRFTSACSAGYTTQQKARPDLMEAGQALHLSDDSIGDESCIALLRQFTLFGCFCDGRFVYLFFVEFHLGIMQTVAQENRPSGSSGTITAGTTTGKPVPYLSDRE